MARDDDGLAVESDVLDVRAGRDEHGVPIDGGIDCALNGRIIRGNEEPLGMGRRTEEQQSEEESAVHETRVLAWRRERSTVV